MKKVDLIQTNNTQLLVISVIFNFKANIQVQKTILKLEKSINKSNFYLQFLIVNKNKRSKFCFY